MKRIVIGAGLIVVLAFAAVAVAGIRHYHGTVDEGGIVRFKTKVRDGETVKVKRFVFNRVPMECDDGASTVGNVGTPAAGDEGQRGAQVPRQVRQRARAQAPPHPRQAQG